MEEAAQCIARIIVLLFIKTSPFPTRHVYICLPRFIHLFVLTDILRKELVIRLEAFLPFLARLGSSFAIFLGITCEI